MGTDLLRSLPLGVVLCLATMGQAIAGAPSHLGVASCASTTCHGAARPLSGSAVLQNEYVTWAEFDPHARAYRTLKDERSAAIARRLGIGPADSAPQCLACHAEVVAAEQRGPRFQPDDGIGCEACHGAGQNWLASHDDRAPGTRQQSLAAGLRPLNEPAVRAGLCSGCHVGDGDRLATHSMLAAGHPRLSFELDTFTELWRTSGGREHYRRDADYLERKPEPAGTQVWLTGLVATSIVNVDQVQAAVGGGALPEFAAFNCYSCHRDMGLARWRDRTPQPGGAPGALRLNDSSLRLLWTAVSRTHPAWSSGLKGAVERLQAAANSDRSSIAAAAGVLRGHLGAFNVATGSGSGLAADQQAMLTAILVAAGSGEYPDYATAEQAAMGVVILLGDAAASVAQQRDIDALFAALDDDSVFDRVRFARILSRFNNPAERKGSP